MKHVFVKTPVADAHPLKMEDFQPCCTTPLYDAMGITLTAMRKHIKEIEDSVVVVTIMSIRNSRDFAYSHEGTRASMGKDSSTRMNFFSRLSCMKMQEADGCAAPMSAEERHNLYTSMADEVFDEEEGK